LRWSRADTHPGPGDARGGRATHPYSSANEGRYSDSYDYCVADAYRYAAGNRDGDAFPYAPCSHPDTLADAHTNEHADAPTDANAGSYAHADLASDDLRL
jgi:hypothetical protein